MHAEYLGADVAPSLYVNYRSQFHGQGQKVNAFATIGGRGNKRYAGTGAKGTTWAFGIQVSHPGDTRAVRMRLAQLELGKWLPDFSVNREKVAEVKQEAAVRIDELRHEGQPQNGMQLNPLRSIGGTKPDSGFFDQPPSNSSNKLFDVPAVESIAEAPGKFFGELTHADAPPKPVAEPEKNSLFGNGPISNLKQRFQNR